MPSRTFFSESLWELPMLAPALAPEVRARPVLTNPRMGKLDLGNRLVQCRLYKGTKPKDRQAKRCAPHTLPHTASSARTGVMLRLSRDLRRLPHRSSQQRKEGPL